MHPESYAYATGSTVVTPRPKYYVPKMRSITITVELTVDAVDIELSADTTAAQVLAQLPRRYHPKLTNITEGEVR